MINRLIVSTTYEPYEPASPVFTPITALDYSLDAEAPPLSPSPSPTPPLDDFNVLSCPPNPTPQPIAIPEAIAEAVRQGNQGPYNSFIVGMISPPYRADYTDTANLLALCNSPVVAVSSTVQQVELLVGFGCLQYVAMLYAGTGPQQTSIPGTVIVDTAPPAPVMPVPAMPQILPQVQQTIIDSIALPMEQAQQAIDQITGTAQGQLEYQLQQVQAPLQRILSKIDANIVNTMGEVYQEAYPVGLAIPTPEQIIAGEPVYSPYGIGADIPYAPTPPQTTPPGVTCPAPVVQCPDPPDITFSPNITVNIPQQDGSKVTVEVKAPAPTPTPPPVVMAPMEPTEPTEPSPTEPTEPTPSPTPSPTEPTPTEPSPSPTPYLGGNYTIPTTPTKPKPPPVYHPGKFVIPAIQEGADWSSAAACGELDARGTTWDDKWLNKLLGITTYANANDFIKGLFAIPFVGPDLALGVWSWTEYIVSVIGSVPSSFLGGKFGKSAGPFFGLALAGLGEKIGLPLTFLTKGLLYDLQYTNPQTIPGETEFTSLYLANGISADEFTCMIQANGSYPSWWQRIAQANRTRISNEQIIQLDRRKVIGPEAAYSMLRGNGVLNEADAKLMYTASEALPTVSDIVRFMVRDADDNEVAARYGTDAALDTKYGKQLQSWAKGQGITDQVMQYYWRSHWEIPSNTALFEMYHRLRPAKTGQGLTGGITVSRDDIKDALVVNDVLPFWAERLMEISFKPLTRTDAQRAYFIDAIDENELKDSYLDLGYNEDNADRLVRFTNQLKGKRKQATGGTEKATSVLKYYKNFLLSDVEASARLRNGGLSEKAASDAMQIASKQRSNDSQLACIKGVHSKYKRFIYGDNEARQDLIAIGVPIENIDKLVANWNCERGNKPKELSAAQVCKAYKNELIDEMEYIRRLQAIGYGRDEAGIIFELCTRPPSPNTTKAGFPIVPKTQAEKNAQTSAARAVTQAALDQLAAESQLPTEPPIP